MAYYDFSTFTEVDASNKITVNSSTSVSWSWTPPDLAYLYKDFGTGNIGAFHYRFQASCSECGYYSTVSLFGVGKELGGVFGRYTGTDTVLYVSFGHNDTTGKVNIVFTKSYGSHIDEVDLNTTYYFDIEKSGTSCVLTVYSDSNFSNQVFTRTHSDSNTFRYLTAPCSNDYDSYSYVCSGTLSNLEIPSTNLTATPSGGITVGSTTGCSLVLTVITDGGFTLSGDGVADTNYAVVMDGGVTLDSLTQIGLTVDTSGGLTLGSTTTADMILYVTNINLVMSGGFQVVPSARSLLLFAVESVTNTIEFSGVSVAYHVVDYANLPDTAMLGTPWVTGTITALGLVPLGGFADIRGWIRFSGKATYKDYAYTPSGGVTLAATSTYASISSFLVSAWVEFVTQAAQCVYCRGTQLWFGLDAYRRIVLTINTANNQSVQVVGITQLDAGWHHISGTWVDGCVLSVYLFGVLENSVTASPVTLGPDGEPRIGLYANNLLQWSGSLDELRYSRRKFTAAEVYADYVSSVLSNTTVQSPLAFAGRGGEAGSVVYEVDDSVGITLGGTVGNVRVTAITIGVGILSFTGGGKLGLKYPASGILTFSGGATSDFGYRFLMSGSGKVVFSGDADEVYSRIFSFVSIVDTRVGGTAGRIFFRGSAIKLRGVHYFGSGNYTFKSGGKLGLFFTGDTAWWIFSGGSTQRVRRYVIAVRVPITLTGESVPVDFGCVGSGKLDLSGGGVFRLTHDFSFDPTASIRLGGSSSPARITYNPVGNGTWVFGGGSVFYVRVRGTGAGTVVLCGDAVIANTFHYSGSGSITLSNEDWCFITTGSGILELSGTIAYSRGIVGSGGIHFHSPLVARLLGELTTRGCFDGLVSVGRLSQE
jgi:hypothetical protein